MKKFLTSLFWWSVGVPLAAFVVGQYVGYFILGVKCVLKLWN